MELPGTTVGQGSGRVRSILSGFDMAKCIDNSYKVRKPKKESSIDTVSPLNVLGHTEIDFDVEDFELR